jgi:hypothetical protein
MVSRAPTWELFYKNLDKNLEINLKMDKIMDFSLSTVPESDWISNLIKNPGLSLMLVNGFGKLVLCYLQENIMCSESNILGLCGVDEHAEVYQVDPVSASRAFEFKVPTWRDLTGAQAEADIDALMVPDQNPSSAKVKNSVWLPPLALLTVLEAKSQNPTVLIPLLSLKFQEFDRSSSNVKACTILFPILEYLWAVHKKLVPPLILAVDDSPDASEWASRQLFAYICPRPPMFPVPPAPSSLAPGSPFKSMTEELRKIRETNEKHLLKDSQTADPKKESNGWEKLPDMVQNMVL